MNDDFKLIHGSGNAFRDFGRVNASVEQARAILAAKIIYTLDERGLSTREAERLTGVSHSEFSRIRNARLGRFTLDRMITILGKLDEDVEVNVTFRARIFARRDWNHLIGFFIHSLDCVNSFSGATLVSLVRKEVALPEALQWFKESGG